MEIKDIFFIVGIVSSIFVSLYTLSLARKNRRNPLREHLYKEQISFFSKLLLNVNKLNFETESLINNSSKRQSNNFYDLLEAVSHDYYNSEFLIPNEISGLVHNLIFKSNQFYLVFLGGHEDKIRQAYSTYFKTYTDVLNNIKEFIGTDELSKENKLLHARTDKKQVNDILKLMMEVSAKALRQ